MGIRIPQNQIISKYTSGKEYMLIKTQNEYQGYYYELNNKVFAGKTFDPNNPEIIKIKSDKFNKLLSRASTYVYGAISGTKIDSRKITPHFFNYDSDVRYFSYQNNANLIKEINKDTFDSFKSNSLYVVISLSYKGGFNDQELNEAEKKIPGIRTFINNSYTPPPTEDSGEIG